MLQAIVTKYLGPQNVRGARVKAICDAGEIILSWDDELNVEANHRRAAEALRIRLGWTQESFGEMVGGALPTGGYAFVFTEKSLTSK